jgi:Putative lumazine-binding
MSDRSTINALLDAIERYFDLMFDNDVSRFERVFAPSAQLHGLRDSALRLLPSVEYRSALASRPSPQSKGAPRLQEILSLDFASPSQAMAKVRVRIDQLQYLDYLAFHLVEGRWLITAKSFHVERNFAESHVG